MTNKVTLAGYFGLLLIPFITIIFFFGFNSYIGDKNLYIYFSLISNFSLYYSFRSSSTFFDKIFGLLFWLGFWFKFSLQISFLQNSFPEGVGLFDFKPYSFDRLLIICSIANLSFLIASNVKERFYTYKCNINDFSVENSAIIKFYSQNKKKIILIFLITFVLLSFLNLKFIFFQRGILPATQLPLMLNNFVNWLLFFGFATFSSLLIYLEFCIKKQNKNSIIYLGFIECFTSSISLVSRGMIFNGFALLISHYQNLNNNNIKIKKLLFLKYLLILFSMFLISLIIVSEIRQSKNYRISHDAHNFFPNLNVDVNKKTKKEKVKENINSLIDEINHIIFLVGGRWVGTEGVMVLINNNDKGFDLLKDSFSEKFNMSNSFYENKIKKSFYHYNNEDINNTYTVYTPGIVGFLYYSGSAIFLFISLFFIVIFCNILEFFAFRLSDKNIVFTAIIGNILAYRLIHFGYMPLNTYKIILVIIFNIFLMYLVLKFFKKLIK